MVAPIIAQGKIDQIATWNRPDGTSIPHVCGFTVNTLAQAYLYAVEKMQGSGVAIGTDFNGFAGLPGPVGGPEACPGGKAAGPHLLGLTYPFIATVTGVALDRSQIGQKNYDINDDGLAHVGMLPDLIANLSALGVTEKELDPLLNSADYYIALWNRAVLRTDLYFIKTAHTPSGNVEVHSDGAASNFQQRTLDAVSDFSDLDGANGVWQMAAPFVSGRPTLYFIKTTNTPGQIEVHWAAFDPASASYKRAGDVATDFNLADGPNGTCLMAGDQSTARPDLYFIKTANTPSGNVEVHSDGAASNFQQRTLDAASDFSHLDGANGVWQMAAP